jgi:hypothetical protein
MSEGDSTTLALCACGLAPTYPPLFVAIGTSAFTSASIAIAASASAAGAASAFSPSILPLNQLRQNKRLFDRQTAHRLHIRAEEGKRWSMLHFEQFIQLIFTNQFRRRS